MSIVSRINNHTHSDFCLTKLPKSAKIEIVNYCNHKCPFCMVSSVKEKMQMSLTTFTSIIEELKDVKEIGLFFMGESTLHPKLNEFNKICKQHNKFTFITTNGMLLNPLLELIDSKIDSIKVSLNGYDEESWISNTGVNSFKLVVSNLFKLREYIKNTGSKTELSVSSIFYNNKKQQQFIKSLPEDIQHYYLPLYSQAGDNSFKLNKGNTGIVGNEVKSIPCWALFTQAHIKVNGDLCACCFGCNKKFIMGNILESGFEKCWNSPKFLEVRRQHLSGIVPPICKNCLE